LGEAFDVGFDSQDIGIAVAVRVSMRACAEAKIREGMPVLEVVAAHKFRIQNSEF
jgi:hypothetical protein